VLLLKINVFVLEYKQKSPFQRFKIGAIFEKIVEMKEKS
jgi:hypothetical protein